MPVDTFQDREVPKQEKIFIYDKSEGFMIKNEASCFTEVRSFGIFEKA